MRPFPNISKCPKSTTSTERPSGAGCTSIGRVNGPASTACSDQSRGSIACQAAADPRAGRRGHRLLIAEQRDEELAGPARRTFRQQRELGCGRIHGKAQDRLLRRRQGGMIGQQELRLRRGVRLEREVGHRAATDEVGPAVPAALLHHVEQVRRIADRARAAVIGALIGREQPSVGQERQTIGIAQAPGEQLE